MSFKIRALRGALMLGACAWPVFAHADDTAPATVDSVIVTGARNPEDPPIVQDARKRLSLGIGYGHPVIDSYRLV